MRLERTYPMPDEEALDRAKALTEYWSAKHGVKTSWTGASARIDGNVKGVRFDGTIEVRAGRLVADIKAGFLAEKLGGKKYVEGKLDVYLDPSKSLEELRARAR